MTNTTIARDAVRSVTRSCVTLGSIVEQSTEGVLKILAACGVTGLRASYRMDGSSKVDFVTDSGAIHATAQISSVTTIETGCSFIWHNTGAAYFPFEIDHDGKVWRLTGMTGHVPATHELVADYRMIDGDARVWAHRTMQVCTDEVSAVTYFG